MNAANHSATIFEADELRAAVPPHHDALVSFDERIAQLDAQSPIDRRTKQNLERALASINADRRKAFLRKHRERLQDLNTFGPAKYADFAYWAHQNVMIAQWLELDRSPPMSILDIGMGSGSFAMVAQSMGHHVVGTDVADDWYGELCSLAGVSRLVAPVRRGEAYRPVGRRFDLITIMLPAFHRKRVEGRRQYWSVEEWRQLLSQLSQDLLEPGGALFILMTLDLDDAGTPSYSPLLEWAASKRARLDRTTPDEHVRHILFKPVRPETFEP